MAGLKLVETCRMCGENITHCSEIKTNNKGRRIAFDYLKMNLDGTRHHCERYGALKVFSEEERKEFERRRLSGDV